MVLEMRKMKDSGIEWIGEIPEGWEVVPVKRLCTMQAGRNLTSEQIAPEGTYPVYGGNGIRGFFSDYNCDGQFLTVGRQGALCGNVHKINGKVWATEHAVITTPSSYTILDFLYYLLIGMDLNQYVSSTAAQPGLAVGTLLNLKTCYPCSTLEQTQISNYLNAKCSEIDVMLTKTRSSIEEYKKLKQTVITQAVTKGVRGEREMKDSGVEWIGEIPAEWSITKIKSGVTKIGSGKTPSGGAETYTDSGVIFLRSQNVYDCTLNLESPTYISPEVDATMKSTRILPDDVLLNITGGSIGRCSIVPKTLGLANVNQHVCIIRTNPLIFLPKYMQYFWVSTLGHLAIDLYQTGGNREGMSADAIRNTPIPYAPLNEQKEIADYLDAKCAEIDGLTAKKEQLVKELESYKKSLIYEVVTGKREV